MPNHCENDLRVNGSKQDIENFFATLKGDDDLILDANKIIPYPKHFQEADQKASAWRENNPDKSWVDAPKDGYNSGGGEWCISNWGTKWGMYQFSPIKLTKVSAVVSFSTAWAPATHLILKASEMFPSLTLTLRYYEQGVGFKGVYKVKAGNVLDANETTYRGSRGG